MRTRGEEGERHGFPKNKLYIIYISNEMIGGNRSLQAGRSSAPSAAPSPTKDAGCSGSTSAPHMSATKVQYNFKFVRNIWIPTN